MRDLGPACAADRPAGALFRRRHARDAVRLHPVLGRPHVRGRSDRYEQRFVVREGHLCPHFDQAALKLAEMRCYSGLTQVFELEERLSLESARTDHPVPAHAVHRRSGDPHRAVSHAVLFGDLHERAGKLFRPGRTFQYDILSLWSAPMPKRPGGSSCSAKNSSSGPKCTALDARRDERV